MSTGTTQGDDTIPEPEVLPEQFFPDPYVADTGARRLVLAVLANAVETLRLYHDKSPRLARSRTAEVIDWITSDDELWPFSYINVCGYLNIEPGRLRRTILEKYGPKRKEQHDESHESHERIDICVVPPDAPATRPERDGPAHHQWQICLPLPGAELPNDFGTSTAGAV